VLEVGKPTVVVLMAGSSIDLTEAEEKADAILLSWYPGALGGKALADLLFGRGSPSGKLPVTFYRNEALGQMPDFTDYSMLGRTYRYYQGVPLYPFGYGLTYGKCSIQDLRVDNGIACVRVRNDGDIGTEEVIELYLHDEQSPHAAPNPVLCGFTRIYLNAKEEAEFSLPIDPDAFTVVDDQGTRIPGSGTWKLFAGFGAPDKRTEELTGRKAVCTEITR
jgi:beta-glucosidase